MGSTRPPETWAWIKGHKSVRFGLSRLHHFPVIDAHFIAQDRHLIGEGDVEITESVFQDFFHLSHCRTGDLKHFPFEHISVEGRLPSECSLG